MQTDEQFLARMIKSARDRRTAGALTALDNLQKSVAYSIKMIQQGEKPNVDLATYAIRAQQSLAELEAVDEIVALYELPPSGH